MRTELEERWTSLKGQVERMRAAVERYEDEGRRADARRLKRVLARYEQNFREANTELLELRVAEQRSR